ncbi:hypothetical protein ACH4YO_22495 [Streptomyces noursei]|uniref:hypothetical protein n=1 Tax=Streptomyces noursei TaxID=1971 RepID=UPI0033DB3FB6
MSVYAATSGASWLTTTSVRPRSALIVVSRSITATAVSGASAEVISSQSSTSGPPHPPWNCRARR